MSPARETGKVPATTAGGSGGLDRACRHMERAVAELKAARQAWGVWAEGIGQRAERRLGVTGLGDLRVMDDPEYARALDVGAPFIEAVSAAEAALKAGRRCGRSLASRQSPHRLAGDAGGDVPAGLPAVPDKHK